MRKNRRAESGMSDRDCSSRFLKFSTYLLPATRVPPKVWPSQCWTHALLPFSYVHSRKLQGRSLALSYLCYTARPVPSLGSSCIAIAVLQRRRFARSKRICRLLGLSDFVVPKCAFLRDSWLSAQQLHLQFRLSCFLYLKCTYGLVIGGNESSVSFVRVWVLAGTPKSFVPQGAFGLVSFRCGRVQKGSCGGARQQAFFVFLGLQPNSGLERLARRFVWRT